MNIKELLGFMYGLRLEMLWRKEYYYEMARKWKGEFGDKITKLGKAFGCACEEVLLTELLKEMIDDWWDY